MTEPHSQHARPMTPSEVQRGLFPKTMADIRFRPAAFAAVVAGDAAFKRKQAKKAGKTAAR